MVDWLEEKEVLEEEAENKVSTDRLVDPTPTLLAGIEMLRGPIRGWRNPTAWAAAIPFGVRWWRTRAGLERGWRSRARSVRRELTEEVK